MSREIDADSSALSCRTTLKLKYRCRISLGFFWAY